MVDYSPVMMNYWQEHKRIRVLSSFVSHHGIDVALWDGFALRASLNPLPPHKRSSASSIEWSPFDRQNVHRLISTLSRNTNTSELRRMRRHCWLKVLALPNELSITSFVVSFGAAEMIHCNRTHNVRNGDSSPWSRDNHHHFSSCL